MIRRSVEAHQPILRLAPQDPPTNSEFIYPGLRKESLTSALVAASGGSDTAGCSAKLRSSSTPALVLVLRSADDEDDGGVVRGPGAGGAASEGQAGDCSWSTAMARQVQEHCVLYYVPVPPREADVLLAEDWRLPRDDSAAESPLPTTRYPQIPGQPCHAQKVS